jgi:hypothetical protein
MIQKVRKTVVAIRTYKVINPDVAHHCTRIFAQLESSCGVWSFFVCFDGKSIGTTRRGKAIVDVPSPALASPARRRRAFEMA